MISWSGAAEVDGAKYFSWYCPPSELYKTKIEDDEDISSISSLEKKPPTNKITEVRIITFECMTPYRELRFQISYF